MNHRIFILLLWLFRLNICQANLSGDDGLFETFSEILQVPIPFATADEEEKSRRLVQDLTEVERVEAARTSYAFWFLERTKQCPSYETQLQMAAREARRHLAAVEGNYPKALQRLQEACNYRMEHELNLVRSCFLPDETTIKDKSELRTQISSDFQKQPVVMRGHDRQLRAILIKSHRHAAPTTEEEYLNTQLYIAERALACTEFLSRGTQETLVAVFDFSRQNSKTSPPVAWQISAIRTLQHLYPERLGQLIVLDPPFLMRGLFAGIRPFLSSVTRNKIQMVSGTADKANRMYELVDPDHVTPLLLPDGKLTSPVDVKRYLNKVPFHYPYDV